MTTSEGNIKFVIAGNTQPEDYGSYVNDGDWREYRNAFHASYSWESVLDEWFRAVAPALETGSEIEVWPDSGSWRLQVGTDGNITETTTEETEGEEE